MVFEGDSLVDVRGDYPPVAFGGGGEEATEMERDPMEADPTEAS